ncbi:ASCH domain-containing protein [Streptomyces sp. NPDC051563]|uniref:ASCH domain-containing protein n=1 Tax=Streptomyces sp. NPDC051563 TaxID=3365659 RepID=UPI003798EB40
MFRAGELVARSGSRHLPVGCPAVRSGAPAGPWTGLRDDACRPSAPRVRLPGPLGDEPAAAVLSGAKTTATGVPAAREAAGDPLPVAGARTVVLDSAGCLVGVLEVTDVRVLRPADGDARHAADQGEGFASVAEWRSGHGEFRHGPWMREPGSPTRASRSATAPPAGAGRCRPVTRPPRAAGAGQETAAAAARPAARPEKMQPPRKVPSRAR